MIRATIEITGETESDVEIAVEAVLDNIRRGNTSGFDRNDTGSYRFHLEDE